MLPGDTGGTSGTVPSGTRRYAFPPHGPRMSLLRQAPGVRAEPLALDGRHQAALRREPPEGPDPRGRGPQARVRMHALPQGRQGHQGLSAGHAPVADPSLIRFRAVIEGALAHLESRRQEVNDLNVFPVADGDTGDNMALTLRAVLRELDALSLRGDIDDIGREEIVDSVARAALLGARGNSGVILSQLIDPVLIAAAMARAADRAYGSVREPAEGTILTVVREMASRAASEIAHMPEPRLRERVDNDVQDALIAEVLERSLESGEQSVKRGPELLSILREAGVVDAGGYGLTVLFAGVVAALRGSEPPPLDHHSPARVTQPEHESSKYRFCTNFAVTGEDLHAGSWVQKLEALGDSV